MGPPSRVRHVAVVDRAGPPDDDAAWQELAQENEVKRMVARRFNEADVDFEAIDGDLAKLAPPKLSLKDVLDRLRERMLEQRAKGVTVAQMHEVLKARGIEIGERSLKAFLTRESCRDGRLRRWLRRRRGPNREGIRSRRAERCRGSRKEPGRAESGGAKRQARSETGGTTIRGRQQSAAERDDAKRRAEDGDARFEKREPCSATEQAGDAGRWRGCGDGA